MIPVCRRASPSAAISTPLEWPDIGFGQYAVQFELDGAVHWGVTTWDHLEAAGVVVPSPNCFPARQRQVAERRERNARLLGLS
jgi:hypothetical protein